MTDTSAPAVFHPGIRESYFRRELFPGFEAMERGRKAAEKDFRIAGKRVRIRSASPDLLEKLTLALGHLAAPAAGTPDLLIRAHDAASTGIRLYPPQNAADGFMPGEEPGNDTYSQGFRGVSVVGEKSLYAHDAARREAYFWTQDAALLPDWVVAAPLRLIFHWFLAESAIFLMHGAAVGWDGRTALLTAKGGSGKSTTAVSSFLAGADYLGDDYVAVGADGTAHSLYSSAKVVAPQAAAFPELEGRVWNGGREHLPENKALVFLAGLHPERIRESARLDAVLVPVITGAEETRVLPARPFDALAAVLPTSLLQFPLAAEGAAAGMRRILAGTPCSFLELGRDVRQVPDAIRAHLASLP